MIRFDRLPLPCPVNALYRSAGRRTVLSKRARERGDLIVATIHDLLGGAPEPMTGPVLLWYELHPRDKRTPDIDAHCKHLLDCLERAGVYEDDRQVESIQIQRMPPCHPGFLTVEVWEAKS